MMPRETCYPMNNSSVSTSQVEHLWIPMEDGCRLSARLWLPANWSEYAHPTPAILEYIPYRKRDMVRARDERNHPVFASHGYACLRVDMRGSGDSEGQMDDMYSSHELDDALAVIDWISAQNWCDGNVGMMGTSWGGTSALQAAARKPAALKAIIAVCATNNRFADDIHHMGGCLITDTLEWGASLPAILALPPGPGIENWRARWLDRLEKLEFPLQHWIAHETNDEYWRWGSVAQQPGSIECPVLAIGGWSDRYSNSVMNLMADNPESCWGIVGPWGHHYPDAANPGPAMLFQQQALAWWDHWLKAVDNDVEALPHLRVWCPRFQSPADYLKIRQGEWISEVDWPSTGVEDQSCAVHPLIESGSNNGWHSIPSEIRVGRASGDTGYFGRPGGLPLDQCEDDDHSLLFESAPLSTDLQVLGHLSLNLAVRSQHEISTLVARISEVTSEGEVNRVTYTVRNLALDEDGLPSNSGHANTQRSICLNFHNIAYQFSRGNRLRIALSSAYWPIAWPSPKLARIDVKTDSLHLNLPLRRSKQKYQDGYLEQMEGTSADSKMLAPGIERQFEKDTETGIHRYRWHTPLTFRDHPQVGIRIGAETSAEFTIDPADPLSANSRFRHSLTIEYEGQTIQSIGEVSFSATESHFLPQGSIRVIENGGEIFARCWSPEIPRHHS